MLNKLKALNNNNNVINLLKIAIDGVELVDERVSLL